MSTIQRRDVTPNGGTGGRLVAVEAAVRRKGAFAVVEKVRFRGPVASPVATEAEARGATALLGTGKATVSVMPPGGGFLF